MSKTAKPEARQRRCGRCCQVCSCLAFALGVLFVLVGLWSVHLKHRFTTIYTPITCEVAPAQVYSVDWGNFFTGFSFTLKLVTTCDNPNEYSVTLQGTKGGKVYMGRDMSPAGEIEEIPRATLPANGRGSITTLVKIVPTGDTIMSGIGNFFSPHDTPMYFSSSIEILISVKLLGSSAVKTKKSISTDCGLNMKLPDIGSLDMTLGPTVCGESFDALSLPPLSKEAPEANEDAGNKLVIGADSAGPELEEATRLKDESVLLGTVLGFSLGAFFLLCSLIGLCVQLRPCGRHARGQGRELGAEQKTKSEELPANSESSSLPRILGGQRPVAEAKTVQEIEPSAPPASATHDEEMGL